MRYRAILAGALLLAGIGDGPAAAEPVALESGRVEGAQSGAIKAYKGIPYAAPPVGPLRWKPPQPARRWAGVRQANAYSPACPQVGIYPADAKPESTSEDCLTLNIWTTATAEAAKLPVMVWIHGGGLVNGSGSVPNYAGDELARKGVIVVTFNYRLGVLGFLAHPELNRESKYGGSGNYGLLDQVAALKWIQRNIAAFGGDPANVTIFGQSSGGFSVSMLTASPMAKGLFRRAIGQSGGVFEPVELDPRFTPEGSAEAGVRFADRAGAKSIADLRKLPVEALLKARFAPQFNVDGYAIPAAPHDVYAAGRQNDVDLLLGSNEAEGSFFFDPKSVTIANFDSVLGQTYPSLLLWAVGASPGKSDSEARRAALAIDTDMRFRWGMWAWARHAVRSGKGRVFSYRFNGAPAYRPGHPLRGLGPTHGGELPYVFGQLNPAAADWTAGDRALAETMQRYWTNFAKTGDPNGAGLPNWPRFDASQPMEMELGQPVRAAALTDDTRLKRIDRVYGTARFVNANLYAVLAGIAVLVLGGLALMGRFLWRWRKKRAASSIAAIPATHPVT